MWTLLEPELGAAPLLIVAALTIPCLGSFISSSVEERSRQDGQRLLARHLVSAGALLGLASALASARVSESAPGSRTPESLLIVGLWVFLAVQALSIFVEPAVTRRFQNGICCAASSIITLVFITYASVRMQLNISDVPWTQMLAALLQSVASLSLPQRQHSSVDGEHYAEEHATSVISLLCFSWVSSLPGLKTVDDLPKVSLGRRTRTIRDNFHAKAGDGALWTKLARAHRWHFLIQGLLVFIKSLSQFGTRFALHQLLVRLEAVSGTSLEKWICVVGLGVGLVGDGIASGWLIWFTQMWMSSTTTNLLRSLLFEKSTRLQLQPEAAHPNDSSASDKSESRLSLVDLMDNDTVAVCNSFGFWHSFPLVMFKMLFDMTYLAKLIGSKSILIGGAVSLTFLPLSTWLSRRHGRMQKDLSKSHAALFGIISEALPELRQIRFSSMENMWESKILSARNRELAQLRASNVALTTLTLASDLGPMMLSTVALSVYSYDAHSITPSVAFGALSLFDNLHSVVRELPVMAANLRQSWISCQRIERYLGQPEQRSASVLAKIVRLENVSITWPTHNQGSSRIDAFRLRNVSLGFPKGELSIVTGNTGSGKSLLTASILDEADLLAGKVFSPCVSAVDKNKANSSLPRPAIAVVTQPPWVDDCSIRENILFGCDFDEKRYRKVLAACALEKDIEDMPENDMTRAGRNGSMLSGGQKWRIALARALYSPADTLVLEDVLSAVDAHVARWLYENALTGELADGRTRILVTHHPEICRGQIAYNVRVEGGTAEGSLQVEPPVRLPTPGVSTPIDSGRQTPNPMKGESKAPSLNNKAPDSIKRPMRTTFISYAWAGGGALSCAGGVLVTLACRISSSGHAWWLAKWTQQQGIDDSIRYNIAVYILLSFGDGLAIAIQSAVFTSISIRASRGLFENAMKCSLHAPLWWIDRTHLGKVLQTLGDDMYWVDHRVSTALNGLLRTSTQLAFIIFTCLVSGPYTGILSLVLLGVFALTVTSFLERSKKLVRLIPAVLRPILEHASSTEAGLSTIRAYEKISLYIQRMDDLLDADLRLSRQLVLGQRWFHLRTGVFGAIFVVVTAGALVHNKVDAATAGFTIGLALQMKATLSGISGKTGALQRAGAAVNRVLDLGATPTESQDGVEPPHQWPSHGTVALRNVTARYGTDLPLALKDISFTIESRQRVGVIGRTGSGKTTLANALLRFIDVSSGKITIDGVETSQIRLEALRKAIAIIPQDPFLFSGTLRENLDVDGSKSDDELQSVMKRVQLNSGKQENAHNANGIELFNLDTKIGAGGKNISHGQRQLVCLARVLLAGCRILVLDEATSAIDETTDAAIQHIIRREFRDATIVVIAHRLSTVADFDSILVLDDGQVVEFGAPVDLIAKKGPFHEIIEQSGDCERIKAIIKRDEK